MAYTEFAPSVPTLNKARALCDRLIARDAPIWLGGPQAVYTIDPAGLAAPEVEQFSLDDVDTDDVPAEFLDTSEPDYMHGLTEAEKAQVQRAGANVEDKAKYAENLKRWKAGEDWE